MNSKNNYRGHALRIAVEITVLAIILLANSASAATITVDDSGGADYTKIQDAIDNAIAGDTIEVQSGNYFERVVVNKQLTLRGIGMPIVNGFLPIRLTADGITLEGFTATGSDGLSSGIEIYYSNNNTLIGNNANYNGGHGIALKTSSNNTLIGNNANSNGGYGNGIDLSYSSNNTLIGNNANSNRWGGISLYRSSYNTLSGNNANSNNYGLKEAGIKMEGSIKNTISGNNASNNYYGIYLSSSDYNTLVGNNANSNAEGISLYFSSKFNTLLGNNASSNTDIGFTFRESMFNNLSGNNANSNNKGISLSDSYENLIYNNIFNNTNNVLLSRSSLNKWNNSRQSGTNIVGGSYLGGNFWANPGGTGFSQTCMDEDSDGVCDSSLTLDVSNIDYLPLANNITQTFMDIYLPPGATPEERKAGLIKAMDDYFDNGTLTKPEMLSVMDAYFA